MFVQSLESIHYDLSVQTRKELIDMTLNSSLFLRRALLLDAVVSGAVGLVMVVGGSFLGGFLRLPITLLFVAGLILLPFAAWLIFLSTRQTLSRSTVITVVVINALWVIASSVVLVSGFVSPNALGYAFVIFQAVVVAIFAELQWFGSRRSDTTESVASS
jgi:hypothetical protein